MSPFFRKLSWLTQRRRKEAELLDELQFHIEEESAEREARGIAHEESHRAARRDIGNVTLLREETRAVWGWTFLEQLFQDLRYALRTMRNNKAFTALATLSLALGIGANTAIYSFMDALLMRSLPVAHPESLVVLNWHAKSPRRDAPSGDGSWEEPFVMKRMSGSTFDDPKLGFLSGIFPFPALDLLRDNSKEVFSSLIAYYPTRKVNVIVNNQAELTTGEYVSGDYFSGLAVIPVAGRVILPDDDRAGAPAVAVLSYAFSQRHFSDAARAPGQSILINHVPFTVAGVAPPGFFGVDPAAAPDVYVPIYANLLIHRPEEKNVAQEYSDQHYYWLEMMARLRPGTSPQQAQAALGPLFHQWVTTTAANDQERANLPALLVREGASGLDTLRRQYSQPLYVLLAMVGLILAIACANIANLLLARATARRREMAVRLGMGAGRFRVIRQLLTESVLLASIGGALGVVFALWGIRFLTLLLANGVEAFILHPDVNWHVLGVALALSMITGILFGLAPALQSTRADVMPALKETRAGQPRPRQLFRRAGLSQLLLTGQIAVSLLILVAAGLFVRTLSKLQSIELGFNRENLLLFQVNARQAGHKDPEILAFYRDLQDRFAAIPGVRSASVSQSPLLGEGTWGGDVVPVGKQRKAVTHVLITGAGFLTTMQIPILSGRAYDERDRPTSLPVIVVNESYVKTNFGNQNPLGQHVVIDWDGKHEVEIIGVAKNARYGKLKDDFWDVVYLPYDQSPYISLGEMTFALRTTGDPFLYANAVREIVHRADPSIPVTNVKTQAAQLDQVLNQEIIFARLCTVFAILALVIACVGLYGTVSYKVARRTSEIGIRMALGAQRGGLVRMLLREVAVLAALGLAIGLAAALGTAKLVASFLYGIKANDPVAFTVAAVTLLGAALLAGYVPARKASRIDPMVALRHE